MNDRRRVLFVRRGGLGDTLLMVPVLRALRRRWEPCEVGFAGVLDFAVLLRHYGVVEVVRSSEDLALWSRGAAWWRGHDVVVTDDASLPRPSEPGVAWTCFDPRPRDRRPLALQVAEQLQLSLRWPEDAGLRPVPAAPRGPVAFAPGSGGRAKCWPRERWLALAREVVGRGRAVDVLVGPVEIEHDDPRTWPWPVPVAFVVEPDLVAVAQRLEHAAAFIGNDSGTTHLAAMLGVPTVALFGPSDPEVFAPIGPRVTVLGGCDPSFSIEVDRVAAALAVVEA